jgi:SAM-dependent methyltransferase
MWSLGDYGEVSPRLEPYAIALADLCRIQAGMKVLDVAAGNGNFAVAAARRGAEVTACDLTPRMIDLGRARTEAAGLAIEWMEGDAERLPVPDARFDVVASVFGAMFAPRPDRVAAELFRASRPGGSVAMANYGWDGYLGGLAKILATYSGRVPVDLPPPFEWGEEEAIRGRFDGLASAIDIQPGVVTMDFDSVDDAFAFFERTNGPHIALKSMQPADRYALFEQHTRALMRDLNQSADGRLELQSAYLSVVARK